MKILSLAPLVLTATLAGCASLPARQDASTAWVAALSACDAIVATDDHAPIGARLRAGGFADGTGAWTWVWHSEQDDSVRVHVEPAMSDLGENCIVQVNQSAYTRDAITAETSAWLTRSGYRNDPTASGVRPDVTVLAARKGDDAFVLVQNAPTWMVSLSRD